jgi:protein-S-isoprenylcysteine O-methyltransferase Ste14
MDTARYVVGCLLVTGLPPGLAWWFVVHPFVDFWRRVGVRTTLVVLTVLALLGVAVLFRWRHAILMTDLGTGVWTSGIAVVLLAGAVWIGLKRRTYLTTKILAGVPELEAGGKGGELLTEGPYGLSRNPRYLEIMLGVFAYAAFSNYLGGYLVAAASVPALHVIVLLEERELADRFGAEYDLYRSRVPRYLPKWSRQPDGR